MIAYKIQLQYVMWDKLSPRQNPVQDKIQGKKIWQFFFQQKIFFNEIFLQKYFLFSKKNWQIFFWPKKNFLKEISLLCKVQPRRALLGYPFCNTAAHTEAMPTREGI